MERQVLARLSELADGDIVAAKAGDEDIVVLRDGDAVRAFQRHCPHQRADLVDGIVSQGHLVCALHGWRFSTADGALEFLPTQCLKSYPLEIDGDEIVLAP